MASSTAPADRLLPIGLVNGIAAEDRLGRRTRLGLGEVSLSSCFQLCSHEKSTNFRNFRQDNFLGSDSALDSGAEEKDIFGDLPFFYQTRLSITQLIHRQLHVQH